MTKARPLVLIIDDELIFQEILKNLLRDECDIRVASNAMEAMQKVLEAPQPDLILLDWVMPDIDGLFVCQQFKQNPRTATIPILFLTAKDNIDDELRGFEAGAVDYIHKPVSPPLLLARVRTHLELNAVNEKLQQQKQDLEHLLKKRNKELAQARSLALSWFETIMKENEHKSETSAFYLDTLKENLDSDRQREIQHLLDKKSNITKPKTRIISDRALILEQLDNILTSVSFVNAKKMRSLLTFIVTETLDGCAKTLKAFTIAVEVFQRDASFDPQQDPIIRVQAGNLRKRLKDYYLTDGKDDVIIIEIPKGAYSAVFSRKS